MNSDDSKHVLVVVLALIVVAILLVGTPMLWRAGVTLGHMAIPAILASGVVKTIVAYCVPLLVTILGFVFLALLIFIGVRIILMEIESIGETIGNLSRRLSREAKEAVVDAGFMAAIGLLSTGVAYMATNDFLDEISTIKILAVSAIGYAVFKQLMLIPIRTVQILGGALTIALLAVSMYLVFSRHHVLDLEDLKVTWEQIKELKPSKIVVLVSAIGFSAASVLFPFTPSAWKKKIIHVPE